MRVRCNWCDNEFNEVEIKIKDDKEYCPICGKMGCLMDLPETEEDYEEIGLKKEEN